MSSIRWRLDLAYCGTAYCGWQRQRNAPTVQAAVEEALRRVLSTPIEVVGAGRTDTGVHAEGYVAHCDAPEGVDLSRLLHALNGVLPRDIALHGAARVHDSFHARFDAVRRVYEYRIARRKDPFAHRRAYIYTAPLDVGSMERGASLLLSQTDFASFCRTGTDAKTTICHLTESWWRECDHLLVYRVAADRFLRNMVRALVGSMLELGRGRWSLEEFGRRIAACHRSAGGPSAVADGLYLVQVDYPECSTR